MSAAPAPPLVLAKGPPAPATPPLASLISIVKKATDTSADSYEYPTSFIGWLRHSITWTTISAIAFLVTFGMVFVTSGVDLTSLDVSNLKVWWVGTLLSSFFFLLLFFVVFRRSEYFNKALLFIIFVSFVITHTSLLLTQINLRV